MNVQHPFETLRDRLNANARRHFDRTYEDGKRADRECRLSWKSIEAAAKRLGVDVHLAVPGDQWDERGGGYWRVVHLSLVCAQNRVEAVVIEDSDSPWMHDNFELFWRHAEPAATSLIHFPPSDVKASVAA